MSNECRGSSDSLANRFLTIGVRIRVEDTLPYAPPTAFTLPLFPSNNLGSAFFYLDLLLHNSFLGLLFLLLKGCRLFLYHFSSFQRTFKRVLAKFTGERNLCLSLIMSLLHQFDKFLNTPIVQSPSEVTLKSRAAQQVHVVLSIGAVRLIDIVFWVDIRARGLKRVPLKQLFFTINDDSLIKRLAGHRVFETTNKGKSILVNLLNVADRSGTEPILFVVFFNEGADHVVKLPSVEVFHVHGGAFLTGFDRRREHFVNYSRLRKGLH